MPRGSPLSIAVRVHFTAHPEVHRFTAVPCPACRRKCRSAPNCEIFGRPTRLYLLEERTSGKPARSGRCIPFSTSTLLDLFHHLSPRPNKGHATTSTRKKAKPRAVLQKQSDPATSSVWCFLCQTKPLLGHLGTPTNLRDGLVNLDSSIPASATFSASDGGSTPPPVPLSPRAELNSREHLYACVCVEDLQNKQQTSTYLEHRAFLAAFSANALLL